MIDLGRDTTSELCVLLHEYFPLGIYGPSSPVRLGPEQCWWLPDPSNFMIEIRILWRICIDSLPTPRIDMHPIKSK
jgi:hypothetical protein